MKQKTMYAIITGEYSDWDLIGVAKDEELAEAYAKLHNGYVLEAPIITDESYKERAKNMVDVIRVLIRRSGWSTDFGYASDPKKEEKNVAEYLCEKPILVQGYKFSTKKEYEVYVQTNDKEKARKIALDKVNKMIAEELEVI